jgi:hypothetical protein
MSSLIPTSDLPAAAAVFVVSVGVAAVYLYVGYRIADRPVAARSRLASYQLALWWAGLGASVAIGGVEIVLAALNLLPFALVLTLYLVGVVVDCVFLWGLVGFLTYVYTGRYHLGEVSLLYAGFYVAYLYWFFSQSPFAVKFLALQPVFQYATPNAVNIPLELVLVVVLIGPELVGAVLYLSLVRRTRDSAQRYRIALVGGGILLWFGLDVILPATTPAWLLARTVLEVVPGVMSLIAFYPPEWARRRYGATTARSLDFDAREASGRP